MFARRTDWTFATNTITQTLNALKAEGRQIIDLTVSNPTRCGFDYPADLLTPLSNADNLDYDPEAFGLAGARQAVAEYYGRRGLTVDPQRIILTASTSEGYTMLFRLLTDPGDRALFPRPSYPLFRYLAEINDVEAVEYELSPGAGGAWTAEPAQWPALCAGGVRAVVVVNPNNPTGSYWTPSMTNDALAGGLPDDAAFIVDEVFCDYGLSVDGFPSLAGQDARLTFVLGGLSKSLGLPQMKLSWIVVNGPDDLVHDALQRLEIIADTSLSVATPVQNALPQWLSAADTWQAAVRDRLLANSAAVDAQWRKIPEIESLPVQGGWYRILRLPAGVDEEEIVLRALRDAGVFVHPGYFFDFSEGAHLVVSLLPPEPQMRRGLDCLAAVLGGNVK